MEKKIRVLQINSVYNYGSTGRIVKKIHEYLLSKGHESFVIFGRAHAIGDKREVTVEDNVFYIHNDFESNSEVLFGTVFDSHGLHCKKNTEKIIAKIEEINPDLIQLHVIHGFYINYEMLFEYLKKTNRKVVWTLHDCWPYTGFCSHYMYTNCEEYKTGCKTCKFRNVYPYRIFSNAKKHYELKKRLFTGLNMSLVTPSKWLKGELKDSFLSEYECTVINNAIETKDFSYKPDIDLLKEYHLENKRMALAVSPSFYPQKGYADYLELSKLLDDSWQIVLIGVSDKQIKELPSNITGIKRVNNVDILAKWYSNAEVFINLSHEDNYPSVNIEAMSCGTPVIGYKTGGIPEQIEGYGHIFNKGEVNEIAKMMNEKSFERIDYKYDNHMCEDYLELYKSL